MTPQQNHRDNLKSRKGSMNEEEFPELQDYWYLLKRHCFKELVWWGNPKDLLTYKIMEGRFNPYTCNQCYFNVTMKQSPETELGQFRYRNTGQRKYTANLRLILAPHSYDQAAASTTHSATFVLHIFIALYSRILLFFFLTYTLRTESLYVKFVHYNLTSSPCL